MNFIQLTAHFIQFEISSDGTIPSLLYFCRIIKMPIVKKTDTRFMKIYIDYSKADICKIDYSAKEIVPEIIDFPRLPPQQEKELTARVRRNVDRVFRKILKRKKPDIIRIYVGEKDFSWAGQFFSAPSNDKVFHIMLNSKMIQEQQKYEYLLNETIVHELVHAADVFTIHENNSGKRLFAELSHIYAFNRLKWPLWMLDRYRIEGIAELGCRLLWRKKAIKPKSSVDFRLWRYQARKYSRFDINRDTKRFAQILEEVMDAEEVLPKKRLQKIESMSYDYGCAVMLRVLRNLRWITPEEERRIFTFIRTNGKLMSEMAGELSLFPEKEFKLDEEEISRVLNLCLSVNLPLFLEGLLISREDKPIVSLEKMLQLFGDVQRHRMDDRIALFANMMSLPKKTVAEFNKTMRLLVGRPKKEEALASDIEFFHECFDWIDSGGLHDKIDRLYALHQEYIATGQKKLARVANHALHYLFCRKILIFRDLPVFKSVDNLLVVDTALDLLDS